MDDDTDRIDPAARPRRRSFTPEYRAGIVAEYDALPLGSPERGALLRREALYTSHISEWRCPDFPGRFGSIQDARVFCESFFEHYNHVHRHSGIGLHTAASVHYGTANQARAQRTATLDAAYAANPARFRHRRPEPPKLPRVAWINDPSREALIKSA